MATKDNLGLTRKIHIEVIPKTNVENRNPINGIEAMYARTIPIILIGSGVERWRCVGPFTVNLATKIPTPPTRRIPPSTIEMKLGPGSYFDWISGVPIWNDAAKKTHPGISHSKADPWDHAEISDCSSCDLLLIDIVFKHFLPLIILSLQESSEFIADFYINLKSLYFHKISKRFTIRDLGQGCS